MPFIGYTYDKDLIIIIEILDDEPKSNHEIKEENKLYAQYYTEKFVIIQIGDGTNDDYNKFCNKIVEIKIDYWLTKEVPINEINYRIFFDDKNKLGKEFTGVQRRWWDNGQLWKEFFHINGKKFGEYKEYHENGNLYKEYFCVDGKIEGEYKEYHEEGNLEEIDYYVAGEKIKKIE